jgi:hypothetical protein
MTDASSPSCWLRTFCQGWPWTMILPISASQVVRVTCA